MEIAFIKNDGNYQLVMFCSLLVFWVITSAVPASEDYRYAMGLMRMSDSGLDMADLVERFASRLQAGETDQRRRTGTLILASLRRKQARTGNAGERQARLKEADALYQKFLRGGEDHPLYGDGANESQSISLERARALLQEAREYPDKANELRRQAAKVFKGEAGKRKAEAAKRRPAIKGVLERINNQYADRELSQVPRRLLKALEQAATKYIEADQRFLQVWAEEVAAYPADAPEKRTSATAFVEYCEEKLYADDLGPFLIAGAWYRFMQGKVHAFVLEEKKATKAWKDALTLDLSEIGQAGRKALFRIKRAIYYDLVKLKMQGATERPERFAKVVEIVADLVPAADPETRAFLREPAGKSILIDYAEALTRKPGAGLTDYEAAARWLRQVVSQGLPWANNAYRGMAALAQRARAARISPTFSAQQWFDAAHGFYLLGQGALRKSEKKRSAGDGAGAATLSKEAEGFFEQAVDHYRKVVECTRDPRHSPLERLSLEPVAWFEMGLCLLKTESYLESILANKALREAFSPEARKKWLPRIPASRRTHFRQTRKRIEEAEKTLDGKKGFLNRARKNMAYALKRCDANKRGAGIPDEIRMMVVELQGSDPNYAMGMRLLKAAKAVRAQGDVLLRSSQRDAAGQYKEAIGKFEEAARRFGHVRPEAKAHEAALYNKAASLALAQSIANPLKLQKAPGADQRRKRSVDLAKAALVAYGVYQKYIKQHAADPDLAADREKRSSGILLSRMALHMALEEWDQVITDGRAFLGDKANTSHSGTASATFNLFRALCRRAGTTAPPACDSDLAAAEDVVPRLKIRKDYHLFALRALLAACHAAAEKAEKSRFKPTSYLERAARCQEALLKLKKEPDLDDFGRLLHWRQQLLRHSEAADVAAEMLQRFDPKNRNGRVDDGIWPGLLDKMFRVIRYDDLQKWERCKRDHRTLIDYMYDNEGLRVDHERGRAPLHDRHPADPAKAMEQARTIRSNYPDCPTVRPLKGRDDHWFNGKGFLQTVADEAGFRYRILAGRQLLVDSAIKAAAALENQVGKQDDARRYRSMADKQIQILLEIDGNVPEWKMMSAKLRIANKDYAAALEMLYDVKRGEPDSTSALYVEASIMISQTYFKMRRYKEAVVYPHRMLVAGPGWRKKHWPEMPDHLERCYKGGAERPKNVEVKLDVDYQMTLPMERAFRDLRRRYGLAGADVDKLLAQLRPNERRRFVLLRDGVVHLKALGQAEERAHQRQADGAGKPLPPDFWKRLEVLRKLTRIEGKAWKTDRELDEAIVTHGGLTNVPKTLRNRNALNFKKVSELKKRLAELERSGAGGD